MIKKKNRAPIRNRRKYTLYVSKRNLPDIIDFAKGSAASAAGVGVGTAIAGPIGGIAGGIAASSVEVMFRKFVSKHIHRNLSINEEERLRKVLSHFNTKMIQNLSVGVVRLFDRIASFPKRLMSALLLKKSLKEYCLLRSVNMKRRR